VAQNEVNEQGGVLGKNLALDIVDSVGQPELHTSLMSDKLKEYDTKLVISSDTSAPVAVGVATSQAAGAVLLTSAASGPDVVAANTEDLLFVFPPPSESDGVGAAKIMENQGIKSVSIVRTGRGSFVARGKAFAAEFAGTTHIIEWDEKDAGSVLATIASNNDDAVFLIVDGTPALNILNAWAATPTYKGAWYGFALMDDDAFLNGLPEASNGFRVTLGGDIPLQRALEKKVTAAFDVAPNTRSRLGENYDAVYIAALAMTAAKTSTDGAAIRDAVRMVSDPPGTIVHPGEYKKAVELLKAGKDINYEGVAGPLDFDATGVSVAPFGTVEAKITGSERRFEIVSGAVYDPLAD
jgi:branched-chain amino acid transport system substrate-binding protein